MFTKGDNYAKILEEESSKLIKLNKENKDYCKYFLLILGNKRNKTYANLSSELFDIIAKIFQLFPRFSLKKTIMTHKKNLLILSQTYYNSFLKK